MILLTVVAVGLLTLSSVSLRTGGQASAQAEARANARLALFLAIGELQKEMGPDMRVSGESALLDNDAQTEKIDGVGQSHWLASYNSWGNWLNASYTPPDGGGSTDISDTYAPKRERMFRRWLLSLPAGQEKDINAANSMPGLSDPDWVTLVGKGSLGIDPDNPKPGDEIDKITRAYLTKIGNTGKHAWWIGPENHKARIDMAKNPRPLDTDEWQTAQGDTAEVGVGGLAGFDSLDNEETFGNRLVTTQTLRSTQVDGEVVQKHFFDLTSNSQGVLASVRSGHLKKDLSLLFEKGNSQLPAPYKFNPNFDVREPSIRPMSPELAAKNPKIPNRHFASWTNMRHYYRMYRQSSDATTGGTGGAGSLRWIGQKPTTDFVTKANVGSTSPGNWNGSNNYWRFPVLAKLTFIYSLMSKRSAASSPTNPRYELYIVYSPVFTYWNPYNVELRIPSQKFGMMSSAYRVLPFRGQFYLGNNLDPLTSVSGNTQSATQGTINVHSYLDSGKGDDVVFKPGEIRIFSHNYVGANSYDESLLPGFDPRAIGGELRRVGRNATATYSPGENPGLALEFSHSQQHGNHQYGNTPGSLSHNPDWNQQDRIPLMYMHDWFQVNQTYTPITPSPAGKPENILRWNFSDSNPVPVAFAQLVVKGLSNLDYESIGWQQDWRCRNWIQSPPSYFGSATYISEDNVIAQTQRLDSPYVMYFGPTDMFEMDEVVPQIGINSFLGAGTSPFEKIVSVPALELPTAPVSSLAGLSGMRINPGWSDYAKTYPHLSVPIQGAIGFNTGQSSLFAAEVKATAFQSGVTGPGIGNSFMHPMLPRTDVYQNLNNSVSMDPEDRRDPSRIANNGKGNDTKVFCDYWDHVFLLNDALWDDYFISSLADQTRPGAGAALSLGENFDRLVAGEGISNSRYLYHPGGRSSSKIKSDLQGADGYLKTARHLMVDGMFNVNSTSVAAWYALFAGIRERQLVYRDSSGGLRRIDVPSGKRIAISRFDTEVSDQEMDDPEHGANMPDGAPGWNGVRFLDDGQLLDLAGECVKQVKRRGPFLNFSEFINRRLSDDDLGLMGALQSAIDHDDDDPEPDSINYRFKNGPDFMLKKEQLGNTSYQTPEAAEGSRFAGIPGYVIQSDLLRPIGNTLAVRDDTFRVRAYGETLANGKVVARAWCEAVVQRLPEYQDPSNEPDVPARLLDAGGEFSDNPALSPLNGSFGRKFRIESFRWLSPAEV